MNNTAEKMDTSDSVQWNQLVEQFRHTQDNASFEALYKASYSKLYAYLYTLGHNKELAEDAIQNGFLTCYTKIDQLADGTRFVPWMKQICYHEYLALAKKQGRTVSITMETPDGEERNLSDIADDGSIGVPESGIEQEELQKLLRNALDSLPELQRISLISFYYDKKAISFIAGELGVPENTVKTYLSRGRKNMNRQVRDHATAYGLKLVPVAIVPVIAELLKTEVQACEISVTGSMINASLSAALVAFAKNSAGAVGNTAGAAGMAGNTAAAGATGVAGTSGGGTAVAAGSGATASGATGTAVAGAAAKGVSVKVVAGLTAAAIAGGGTAAVVIHHRQPAKEEPAVTISTETAEVASTLDSEIEEEPINEIDEDTIQAYITYLENREYGGYDNYRYTFAHMDDDATPELIEINWSSNGEFDIIMVQDGEAAAVPYLLSEDETVALEEYGQDESSYHPLSMMDADERYYPEKNRILSAGTSGLVDPGVNVAVWAFETFQNDGDGFYRDVNAEINFDNSTSGSVTIDGKSVETDALYTFTLNGADVTQQEYEDLYQQMAEYDGVKSVSFYEDDNYDRDAFLEILKGDYASFDAKVREHENTDTMNLYDGVFFYFEG